LALFLSIVIQSFVVAVDYTQGVKQLQKTKDKLVRLDKLKNEFPGIEKIMNDMNWVTK